MNFITLKLSPFSKEEKKERKKINSFLKRDSEVESFEINQIFRSTFDKTYKIHVNQDITEYFEAVIEDGLRKKNTIQVFTKKLNAVACTCEDFGFNQLAYCQHIALIDRLKNGLFSKSDYSQSTLNPIVRRFWSLAERRNSYRGKLVKLFLPREGKYITFGRGNEVEVTAVGNFDTTFIDFNQEFENRYSSLKEQNVTSTDLLGDGVNLYDYQEEIFLKMLAAKRCLCSMIMGSGKSLTSIAVFAWLQKNLNPNFKVLIIAPKSLKSMWQKEFKRTTGIDVFLINNEKDLIKYQENNYQIGAITYQLAAKEYVSSTLSETKYDMIILDEMQYVRNKETKAWAAISKLQSEFMLGLSGTFIENNLDDFYSIMSIISPKILGPLWKFREEFQNISNINSNVIHFRGVKNIELLREKIKCFVFSYNKLDLPKLNQFQHFITLNNQERQYHDYYMGEANRLLSKSMNQPLTHGEKMMLQAYLLKARQSTNTIQLIEKDAKKTFSSKLEKFINFTKEKCIDQDKKIVVFSAWTEMLDICNSWVKNKFPTVETVFFTGRETIKERDQAVKSFQENQNVKIFFASDAGGVGLDGLQKVSHVVLHTELAYNPAKMEQRAARLHRIGQTKEVEEHFLIGKDTVETKMLETLYEKTQLRMTVLYNKEPIENENSNQSENVILQIKEDIKKLSKQQERNDLVKKIENLHTQTLDKKRLTLLY